MLVGVGSFVVVGDLEQVWRNVIVRGSRRGTYKWGDFYLGKRGYDKE